MLIKYLFAKVRSFRYIRMERWYTSVSRTGCLVSFSHRSLYYFGSSLGSDHWPIAMACDFFKRRGNETANSWIGHNYLTDFIRMKFGRKYHSHAVEIRFKATQLLCLEIHGVWNPEYFLLTGMALLWNTLFVYTVLRMLLFPRSISFGKAVAHYNISRRRKLMHELLLFALQVVWFRCRRAKDVSVVVYRLSKVNEKRFASVFSSLITWSLPPGISWFRFLFTINWKLTRTIYLDASTFKLNMDRTSGGRLHLLPDVGKIPLADATLVEDPNDSDREEEGKCHSR